MDRNYCKDHTAHEFQIKANELRIISLETKLWLIILLLFTNLGGIVGILITH